MNTDTNTVAVAPATAASDVVTPTAARSTRVRFEQNQRIAQVLAASDHLLQAALSSPALAAPLAMVGYGANEIGVGQQLLDAAQAAFAARQAAHTGYVQALAAREAAFSAAYDDYRSYRATVQANFTGSARAALCAGGPIARDHGRFLSNARGAYAAARQTVHRPVLERYGFNERRFAQAEENLRQLGQREAELLQAERIAEQATLDRDGAAAVLDAWTRKFRRIARVGLSKSPELLASLGV
jgi:hypothetical protein